VQPGQRGAGFYGVRKASLYHLQPEGDWITYPAGQALMDNNGSSLAWIAGPPERFTAKDHLFESGEPIGEQVVPINDERAAQSYRVDSGTELDRRQISVGERTGQIGPAENLLVPVSFTAPEAPTKSQGRITLEATIGIRRHRDEFAFRVIPDEAAADGTPSVQAFDPEGATTKLLRRLGYTLAPWAGKPRTGQLVAIGWHALDGRTALPGSLEQHVAVGGRLLIFGQSPDWLREAVGLRVAHHVSRRLFPVPSQVNHPVLTGLDAEDFRDWRGAGTLVPETWGGLDEWPDATPRYGWHWGNQGSVSSCAVEKPHYSGWRPILEGEFDLAYSPLMELHYGTGLALLCTLDVEGRTRSDPVAERVARRIVDYALKAPPEPRATAAVYLGGDDGRRLLRSMGLRLEPATELPTGQALAVLGGDAVVTADSLESFLRNGGKALLLPRPPGTDPWGAVSRPVPFRGAGDVPNWPECRGLSLSDLRLRGTLEMAPVTGSASVVAGAGGWLGRMEEGEGVAILVQLTADMLLGRVVPQPVAEGEGILRNTGFADGLEGWNLGVSEPAQATAEVTEETPPELMGQRSAKVVVARPSETSWHVQLSQPGFGIQAGVSYVWTAWTRASAPCSIIASIEKNHPPFGGAGLFERVNLTTEWQRIRIDFTPTESDDSVRFGFRELARQSATYWFAAPSFMAAPDRSVPREVSQLRTFYSPDYMDSFALGDDRYRYYRW
jgi:beta-galactosidase